MRKGATPVSQSRPASRIVSIVRAAWASVWLFVIPKELWGLLCVWPTLFLAVASHAWEPSGPGKRLILLAALWDLVMGFWLMLSAMKVQRDALAATVMNLRDCTYTPIGWDRILRQDDAARIDERSLTNSMNRLGLPYEQTNNVRFLRVGIGQSGGIPGGLGVFNIPFIEAVALVRDNPAGADTGERFALYHELGHSLGDECGVQAALHKGVKPPLVALLLTAVLMQPGTSSLLILTLCLAGLGLMRLVLLRRGRDEIITDFGFRALAEMKADQFAIRFLDEEERRYVRRHADSVLPQDHELSASEHQTRIVAAKSFIEAGVPLAPISPDRSRHAVIIETQLAALNLGAWMILLASFTSPPSTGVVHRFQWLIAATFALAVLRYAIYFWKGILLELIFIDRIAWKDGKFQIRRGLSHAQPSEGTT
jgi:hypothetical protein